MAFHIPRPKPWWTPRYVVNRVRWMFWQKRHPDKPWLTPAYVRFIEQWLSPRDVLVEFGSGRSTAWFAEHVGQVISVEHNPQWHQIVQGRITQQGLRNIRYFLSEPAPGPYVGAADAALDGKANAILIDGVCRDACAIWALKRITPGGLIMIDNAERYLPNPAGSSVIQGLRPDAPPATADWQAFAEATRSWRKVWFGNGVTETLICFAPA
ncbi:MAG: class I SAM-dependent methyltransferase [Phycisphaeraceae bacterium]|nr:class I SAM-dependent methyltransferase [Phycisphaeraceae bacterium]